MKQAVTAIAAAALAAALASAAVAEVAPTDIVWGEDGSIAESLTGTPGNAEEGAKIATTKSMGNCVSCHVISSQPQADFQGNIGPALDGAGDRWAEAQLRGIVVDAKKTFPDSMMPGHYKVGPFIRPGDGFTGKAAVEPIQPILAAQQIEDLVAFLMTQKE